MVSQHNCMKLIWYHEVFSCFFVVCFPFYFRWSPAITKRNHITTGIYATFSETAHTKGKIILFNSELHIRWKGILA